MRLYWLSHDLLNVFTCICECYHQWHVCPLQASLSLPGSPFNLRRGSRGSHQLTLRNGRGRLVPPGADRKPLVLSTYLDAQEHLPYADDSNAVTPMSEENGAIIVPVYYANLG